MIMRKYNTGISNKAMGSVIAAMALVVVIFVAASYPGGNINPTPTTLGARTAEFLNSMRDNVQYYFMCNSTLVNDDLSDFYSETHPGAYVDGVRMNRTADGGNIDVLFSPWDEYITGTAHVSTAQWNTFSGILIDDCIGKMEAPETPPDGDFPLNWPINFYFSVFFDDNTCFFAGFSAVDGYLYIQNGTWTGEFGPMGWPITYDWYMGYWLVEGGHLAAGMSALYTLITDNVVYPE
jgi:hypothetical protein